MNAQALDLVRKLNVTRRTTIPGRRLTQAAADEHKSTLEAPPSTRPMSRTGRLPQRSTARSRRCSSVGRERRARGPARTGLKIFRAISMPSMSRWNSGHGGDVSLSSCRRLGSCFARWHGFGARRNDNCDDPKWWRSSDGDHAKVGDTQMGEQGCVRAPGNRQGRLGGDAPVGKSEASPSIRRNGRLLSLPPQHEGRITVTSP